MAADHERGATAPRSILSNGDGWSAQATAAPASVGPLRRALVAFAAGHGADVRTQGDVALAASEALTNAVVHAYVGAAPGTVRADAVVAGRTLHVTITDDGRGMAPRADSPGLGFGLPTIAHLADRVSIVPGPGGRGTAVHLEFTRSTVC